MCIKLKYYFPVNIFLLQHTANVIRFRDVADDIIFTYILEFKKLIFMQTFLHFEEMLTCVGNC